ncbi:putative palmitoyltransferase ZDHHC7 [Apostichopus japonicus]|uniref:Palmitoyltransferase n=1 Tax=Stichopus japonicus TaxID=307972 RepID=A0A2G8L2U5_STIJA|nr:putative palmitoyltransferase ZDHHC7 [Apostichopus japonicus]
MTILNSLFLDQNSSVKRINNCVGEFNQKYFIQFLFYVGVASIYAITLIILGWMGDCRICHDLHQKNARIAHTIVLIVLALLFGLFVCAIGCDQMSAIFDDETAVEQVQHKGGIKEKTEKTTMQLLREVFGKGPIYCWLLPCRTTRYPLLTPPGYDV